MEGTAVGDSGRYTFGAGLILLITLKDDDGGLSNVERWGGFQAVLAPRVPVCRDRESWGQELTRQNAVAGS